MNRKIYGNSFQEMPLNSEKNGEIANAFCLLIMNLVTEWHRKLGILVYNICLTVTSMKVVTNRGTSPCDSRSWGQVPSCELAIFASKSSRRDQLPATNPTNSTQFEFLGRFVLTVRGTSPCDLALRVNSSRD